jgi:hypothetical protein
VHDADAQRPNGGALLVEHLGQQRYVQHVNRAWDGLSLFFLFSIFQTAACMLDLSPIDRDRAVCLAFS